MLTRMSSFLSCDSELLSVRASGSPVANLTYLVCIYCVIVHTPRNPSEIQRTGDWPVYRSRHRRPTQKSSPVESQTQNDLRVVGDSLHERVNEDQTKRRGTEKDAVMYQTL